MTTGPAADAVGVQTAAPHVPAPDEVAGASAGVGSVGGDEQRPARRRRRRWPWWVALAVLLAAAYGALSAFRLVGADHDLQAARSSVARAQATLRAGGLTDPTAVAELTAAASDCAGADRATHGRWWAPVAHLPVVGRQVRSLQALAAASDVATRAGAGALAGVDAAVAAPHGTPAERAALVAQLAAITGRLGDSLTGITLGPSTGLVGPLRSGYDTLAHDLAAVTAATARARAATSAMSTLLQGPSTYLVVAANNAEMRDGTGMFLQAGTVGFDQGSITPGSFTPTGSLSASQPPVAVAGPLGSLWGARLPGKEWRSLGLTPQFADSAAAAAAMWQARGGAHVDGVIAVDVAGLADLLAATGPITVGATTYTADTATHQLLVDQYDGITTTTTNVARREQLGALASAAFGGLSHTSGSLSGYARPLDDAVNGRHLMVWSADPATEASWQAAGVAGAVPADGLMVGLLNQGQNKLDPFTSLSAHLQVTPGAGLTKVTLTVTVTNRPPSTLSPYAAAGEQGHPFTYDGAVAVELPGAAGYVGASGGTGLEVAGRDGPTQQVAEAVSVPPGASRQVQVTFTLLGEVGQLEVQPSARVPTVQWQVAGAVSSAGPTFTDASAHAVRWGS